MNKVVLKENVLPLKLQEDILEALGSRNFPWFFLNDMTYQELSDTDTHCNGYGFFHMVDHEGETSIWNEDLKKTLKPIHDLINDSIPFFKKEFNFEYKKLSRIRVGLQTKISEQSISLTPHIDSSKPHLVVIYYVNTSDGDTVFYKTADKSTEMKRIKPQMGSAVFFNGTNIHGGSSPAFHSRRIVINFLFEI